MMLVIGSWHDPVEKKFLEFLQREQVRSMANGFIRAAGACVALAFVVGLSLSLYLGWPTIAPTIESKVPRVLAITIIAEVVVLLLLLCLAWLVMAIAMTLMEYRSRLGVGEWITSTSMQRYADEVYRKAKEDVGSKPGSGSADATHQFTAVTEGPAPADNL